MRTNTNQLSYHPAFPSVQVDAVTAKICTYCWTQRPMGQKTCCCVAARKAA